MPGETTFLLSMAWQQQQHSIIIHSESYRMTIQDPFRIRIPDSPETGTQDPSIWENSGHSVVMMDS